MVERRSTTRGFRRTSALLEARVRKASEGRGFAQHRVLTQWEEFVGPDLAAQTRPVEVRYEGRKLGATLVVLTTGALAPLVAMRREELRDKVNAVYGYQAIADIRITQTAATGFAEGAVDFVHQKPKADPPEPSAGTLDAARKTTQGVADPDLRAALERLASNVISKSNGGR
jgi:hypothetical protein